MKRTWIRAAIAALTGAVCLLGAACGGGGDGGTDAGAGSGDDGGAQVAEPTKTLTGRADAIYWSTNDAKSVAPLDTTWLFVEAVTPTADGDWSFHPGLVNADGSYEIAGVPESTKDYWFRFFDGVERRDLYLWTNGDAPNLSRDFRGRADQAIANERATKIELHFDGLDTWQDGDELTLGVGSAGFAKVIAPTYASTNAPSAGATTMNGTLLMWGGRPLFSATAGDDAIIAQVRQVTDSATGYSYLAPVRMAQVPAFDVKDGQTSVVNGSFSDAPALDYPLEWKRTAFAALKSDVGVHGGNSPDAYLFRVRASPGGFSHGQLLPWELPVVDSLYIPAEETDISVSIPTHNPFPASWLFNSFTAQIPVPVTFTEGDTTLTGPVSAEIGVVTTEFPSKEAPAAPKVGPPRAITVGGKATTDNVTGVGLDPEIAWTAPALGTPTSYEITLQGTHIEREFGSMPHTRLVFDADATLIVPGDVTHVKLPPNLLEEGEQYIVTVRSVMREGQDVRRAPFTRSLPYAWADAFTAYFAP